MSDSVRPHIRQPTRLPRPWYSPGKNIGVVLEYPKLEPRVWKTSFTLGTRVLSNIASDHLILKRKENDTDVEISGGGKLGFVGS